MNAHELRTKYIEFFVEMDHTEIAGKSLVPENDASVLFTTAGMHPLVPYLLGERHPAGKRLVNYQKCIRTVDIENVGDPSHLTFFEMLGNWSLGDYFKEQAIAMSYEFLTDKRWLGLSADNLSVTVFAGDDLAPADEESAAIWRGLGIPDERIYSLPREDNWWGLGGPTGPCGPDTEMFVDTGIDACGPDCKPGCGCGKFFEIWNDVFMQYNKKDDGTFEALGKPCVDTGMGIERTIAMLQGKKNVYETEIFTPILDSIGEIAGKSHGSVSEDDASMRIIADHVKASVFILGDEFGMQPSNLGQGYILRRLIRRAIRHGKKLGIDDKFLKTPALAVISIYGDFYPELSNRAEDVLSNLSAEEERFLTTLQKGEREFEKLLPNLAKNPKKLVPGRVAFKLYDTYGFPIELTEELAVEHGMHVDRTGFDQAFAKHQELSKRSAEKTFKGGLADHTEETTKLHTATHLLHQALHVVLGEHVQQKGSNITPDRLRFDFSHQDKMTAGQLAEVEEIVNRQIAAQLPVTVDVMTVEEATKAGAFAFFGERYDGKVKVYSIGGFSKEVCGGPHVDNTSELGHFKIIKEQSSSAGIRRIRAVIS